MATRQGALTGAKFEPRSPAVAKHAPTLTARALRWLDRAMLGGGTPRGYRHEGYPEIELQQLISGRKDRFDAR